MPSTQNSATEAARAEAAALRDYLHAVFGATDGHAHVAGGAAGYIDGAGKYSFKPTDDHPDARWSPQSYAWPTDADTMAAALHGVRDIYDVYICPYLMTGSRRTPSDVVELTKIHADIDGDCPQDKVTALGGWAVASGSPSHAHVYVDLAEPIPTHWHETLCRGLGAHLGDADSKISPNDVLRPPGTLNHKGRARGEQSAPVEWLIRPSGVRWDAAALADHLGVTLPDDASGTRTRAKRAGKTKTRTTPGTKPVEGAADADVGRPFDLSTYPEVETVLAEFSDPPDRSRDTMRIVAAVHDAGLTMEHARWAVEQRADLGERLDSRRDDDVGACWRKIATDRDAGTFGVADSDDDGKMPGQARFTDAGLAEIVADNVLRGKFLAARGIGWLQWTGTHWRECGDGPPTEAVRRFVMGRMKFFARKLASDPSNGNLLDVLDAWKKVGSAARITAVLRLATNLAAVEADALDADPDLLNVGNGVVDLRTKELCPHDPDLLMTKISPVHYVPDATHEDWVLALTALPEDVVEWFQTVVGQGATGHRPGGTAPRAYLLHGGGSNGKTTLWESFKAALGDYYVQPSDRAIAPPPGAHPTELMTFRGARAAVIEELPEGVTLSSKRIKDLSGGQSEITARGIAKDDTTFPVTHTLYVTTNHLPRVTATDHGTWRRLLRIPFPFKFCVRGEDGRDTEADLRTGERFADTRLEKRMTDGHDGRREAVLAWVVEGAVRWYANDRQLPQTPASVRSATEEWRYGVDTLMQFFDDELVLDPHSHVMSAEMFEAFRRWLGDTGASTWNDQTFTARLTEHSALGEHVKRERLRSNKLTARTLSRRHGGIIMVNPPGRYMAWLGVRFRTQNDDVADDSGAVEGAR